MYKNKELVTLEAIKSYWDLYHRSPSIRELQSLINLRSTMAVTYRLGKLEGLGLITRLTGYRGIEITKNGENYLRKQKSIIRPIVGELYQSTHKSDVRTFQESGTSQYPKFVQTSFSGSLDFNQTSE